MLRSSTKRLFFNSRSSQQVRRLGDHSKDTQWYENTKFIGGDYWNQSPWTTRIFLGSYILAFVSMGVAWVYAPDNRLTTWAHDEAIVRLQRRKQGLPVEMGRDYSAEYRNAGGVIVEPIYRRDPNFKFPGTE